MSAELNCKYLDKENDHKFRPVKAAQLSHSPTKCKPARKRKPQKSYGRKVESEWSEEQTLKLIQEIKTRPGLWDTRCVEYKMPKEAFWQEIAVVIHRTLNDCKGKWSNLCITFLSNLDKYRKQKSGQGASGSVCIAWKYFKTMLFLQTTKDGRSSQSTSSPLQLITSFDDQPCLDDLSEINKRQFVSPPMSEEQPEHMITAYTLSSASSDTSCDSSLKHMAVDPLQTFHCSGSESKNPSTALCEYMASELVNLSPEQAAFARSKLRRAFNDIMDQAALIFPHWKDQPESRSEFSE